MERCKLSLAVFAALLVGASVGHAASDTQTFPLTDTNDLTQVNVKAEAVEYKGRKAVRLTNDSGKDGLALLRGVDFQDGTIELDLALKITTPPGVRMPGFFGIGFRARSDASHYELFYLRPGNSHSDDQAMRNHSVQYVSVPDFDWYKLRREWPWVYEAYAEQQMETWMKLKIEVKGRSASLFVNGAEPPALVVDGLKGADLNGDIGLWPYPGEEAYFSNVQITHAMPLPIKNGSDASGGWRVSLSTDAGVYDGSLQLRREGDALTGTWSGALGDGLPVQGRWRDGYIELSFDANWPQQPAGSSVKVKAVLAGWIDSDAGGGRVHLDGRADGRWTATRLAGGMAAASDPFAGTWELNGSKSRSVDMMKVDVAGANRYAITFGPGAVDTITADGSDQPGLRGTTLSVAIEAPNQWKVVRKDKGRTLLIGIWKLSKDGATLTDEFTSNKPDGSTSTVNYIYKRTAGSSGFPGTWENASENVNSKLELRIQPYEGDGLSFSTPGDVRGLRFDGKEYPHEGKNVPTGWTIAGVRAGERSLRFTDRIRGEVVETEDVELSPDLKTLTLRSRPTGQSQSNVLVFDRK